MTNAITEQELTEARQIWGDALVAISKAFDTDGIESATAVANGAIDAAYGYNLGPVLFKPTMASGEQTFRPTREGALAYFVGHNSGYPRVVWPSGSIWVCFLLILHVAGPSG